MRASADRCPEDLVARSRRGPLSAVEQRALAAHLGVCALCRGELALAALYDQVPDGPGPDDGALIARLADRATHRATRRAARRPAWGLAAAAGIALVAAAGAAAAWISTRRPSTPPATPEAGRPITTVSPARAPRQASLAGGDEVASEPTSELAWAAPAPAVLPPVRPTAPGPAGGAAARVRSAARAVPAPGAAELFAAANGARRAGDLPGAIARYQALQRRFPAAAEATVSRVSAGELLVRVGEPAAALAQFDGYLRAPGPLAPEALFGRARALGALGRREDEEGAWRDLLSRFPHSVYDGAARRRLDELTR